MLNRQKNKGFSLTELLVSISIVTVIMMVVLFNYSTFNDNLALSSAGQEIAIILRQAQTYGLTVKEVKLNTGLFDSAYGVYVDLDDPKSYYLFADIDGDKKYDVGAGCGTGPTNTECIEKFFLRNDISVSNLCDQISCPPAVGVRRVGAVFLRPNPDAKINFTNSSNAILVGPSLTGKVVLSSPRGKTVTVTIESTGQVLVGQVI